MCRNAHCHSNFEPLHQQMSAGCERYILTAIFCDLVLNLCQMAPLVCETHSRALRHQTNKPRTVKPIKSAWTVDNATGIVSRILNLPATMLGFLDGYESIRSGSTDPSPTHPHERNWVFWLRQSTKESSHSAILAPSESNFNWTGNQSSLL